MHSLGFRLIYCPRLLIIIPSLGGSPTSLSHPQLLSYWQVRKRQTTLDGDPELSPNTETEPQLPETVGLGSHLQSL